MEELKKSKLNIFAAIAFVVYFLVSDLPWIIEGQFEFSIATILYFAWLVFYVLGLFSRQKPLVLLASVIYVARWFFVFFYYQTPLSTLGIIVLVCSIIQIAVVLMSMIKRTATGKVIKIIWFLPVLIYFHNMMSVLIRTIDIMIDWGLDELYFQIIVCYVVCFIAFLLMNIWLAFPYVRDKKQVRTVSQDGSVTYTACEYGEGYIEMAKHVLLLLFTFGIWDLIWIYKTTRYLNCVKGEEYRSPAKKLLLCMFIPFYSIYWTYKSAQRIDKLAAEKNVESDLATLCLILALFIGIVPPILMQGKINDIATKKTVASRNVPASAPSFDASALKELKDLFDSGIITEEEFSAKKKQLLGL